MSEKTKTEKIVEMLPAFYRAWDPKSNMHSIISSVAKALDEQEKDLYAALRSHWVKTANGKDLDLLAQLFRLERKKGEADDRFRNRITNAVSEFRGGGTLDAIKTHLSILLDIEDKNTIDIIENPAAFVTRKQIVKNGQTWHMDSRSIYDEEAKISISVDGGIIINPTLVEMTSKSVVQYNGEILSGQVLTMTSERAQLDGADVTNRLTFSSPSLTGRRLPRLLRQGSTWMYYEQHGDVIGVFDQAEFGGNKEGRYVFDKLTPKVELQFGWTSRRPATIEVRIPSYVLERNPHLSVQEIQRLVNSIKVAGVWANVVLVDSDNRSSAAMKVDQGLGN